MKIDCIEDFNGFLALSDTWDAVLAGSSHDHVCFSFDWFRVWWKAFGRARRLMVLVARDENNKAVAIAPLMQSKARLCGLPVRKTGFIYNDNASRADLIDGGRNAEMVREVVSFLQKTAGSWDVVDLENIWEGSPTYRNLLGSLKEAKLLFGVKEALHSPYISVRSDWDTYLSTRSKNLQKSYRYIRNKLQKNVTWSIENGSGIEGRGIAEVYSISQKSWKGRCRKHITASAQNKNFYELLTATAEKKGWLHLWLLKVNNRYVAYEYALEYKNRIYALKADFDESFRELNPGITLHAHIMKYCFDHGIREYDFCGHDEEYKRRWTSEVRVHRQIVVYRPGQYGQLLYFLDYRIGYGLKTLLKKSSILKSIRRYISRRIG